MKSILLSSLSGMLLWTSCSEPEAETVFSESVAPARVPETMLVAPASTLSVDTLYSADTVRQKRKDTVFENREGLVSFAQRYMGVPYVYAMSDPEKGFDCSGFIYYVYHHFGFQVPRSSIEFKDYGREIPLSAAQTGDLILFTGAQDTDRIGHIGIVIKPAGDSTRFIHASSGKEMAVTISSVAAPHYRKRYIKTINVIDK